MFQFIVELSLFASECSFRKRLIVPETSCMALVIRQRMLDSDRVLLSLLTIRLLLVQQSDLPKCCALIT